MHYQYGFRNFNEFLGNIEEALADERAAAVFYQRLMDMAHNDWQREQINHAREDELKHYHMLHQLYVQLTGREPVVAEKEVKVTTFCAGLRQAVDDELGAMDMYRGMMLSTYLPWVRDILFVIMTDEMEHATRFSMVYADADC